jgi:hypothetical protein
VAKSHEDVSIADEKRARTCDRGPVWRDRSERRLCWLPFSALAENALESERKEHTVGSFEHTPQHLYDVDDPCFGSVESNWS